MSDEFKNLEIKTVEDMPVKKGPLARFKIYLEDRKKLKESKFLTYSIDSASLGKEVERENRKMGDYLKDIENQIMGLDEQNRTLMLHAAAMSENNQALLDQISTLKKNNDVLIEQFKLTQQKNKSLRVLNLIYTALAIVFVVYRMVVMIING